jgi:NitT/TauT family transport system substrate-binding protein
MSSWTEGRAARGRTAGSRLAAAAVSILAASGASPAAPVEAPAPVPVRLMMQWTAQAQFAGYYVAKAKGLFARRGLDVEIIPGGPDRDPVARLGEGKTDFIVLWLASAIVAADAGTPLAHVGQMINSSHLSLVAWKEKGIRDLRDLHGRRVAVWGGVFRDPFTALFKAQGIEPRIITQYATVNLFALRGVDAAAVMDYNEYHVLYQSGIDESELRRFPLKEHGIDFPEDGLYCLRETHRARPETSRSLVAASLEGWRYAAEHQEEALDMVMAEVRAANLPTNRAHMRHMLRVLIPSIIPAGNAAWKAGVLAPDAYERTARWLLDLGEIRRLIPFADFAP